ncbi:hypothetical protein HMI55_006046 [Coelomomyces lativittatus]|nr:hypothetical protein HMI55_006046 [Coelomomyces lativittatus]
MAALNAGFTGGVVVDYPNSSKAKKMYLCLFAGILEADSQKNSSASIPSYMPQGLTGNPHDKKSVQFEPQKTAL